MQSNKSSLIKFYQKRYNSSFKKWVTLVVDFRVTLVVGVTLAVEVTLVGTTTFESYSLEYKGQLQKMISFFGSMVKSENVLWSKIFSFRAILAI